VKRCKHKGPTRPSTKLNLDAACLRQSRPSNLLNWSNYDATFFAVFDQLDSPAFGNNEHAAQAFGTAWFIEAYHDYIESGYAYIRDRNQDELSYHNMTVSYTQGYLDRISNSLRVSVNTSQDLPTADRTADGVLLLVENSWITANPLTFVPYANFFAGWNRPQSIAPNRSPATALLAGSCGTRGSISTQMASTDWRHLTLLAATLPVGRLAWTCWEASWISNSTLWRFDTMYGWRDGLEDVYGTRMEYRWKF